MTGLKGNGSAVTKKTLIMKSSQRQHEEAAHTSTGKVTRYVSVLQPP